MTGKVRKMKANSAETKSMTFRFLSMSASIGFLFSFLDEPFCAPNLSLGELRGPQRVFHLVLYENIEAYSLAL